MGVRKRITNYTPGRKETNQTFGLPTLQDLDWWEQQFEVSPSGTTVLGGKAMAAVGGYVNESIEVEDYRSSE